MAGEFDTSDAATYRAEQRGSQAKAEYKEGAEAFAQAQTQKDRIATIQEQGAQQRAAVSQRFDLAQPYLESLQSDTGSGADLATSGEMSESERILIQSQEEAGERDINLLQDSLSSAGILSSGTLAVGTGEILGRARGQVAQQLATAAESRLTRRHQDLLAKRQQLTDLVRSILV